VTVTAVVLAGGGGERFGGDKLEAELDGRSILDLAIEAVLSVADEVIVAGRQIGPGRDAVRATSDPEPGGGPLVGLAAALQMAQGARAIVVGGDMPALVPAVLRAMLERLAADGSVDAVVLAPPSETGTTDGRPVLPLALDVDRARNGAREVLESGRRSLQRLVDEVRCVALPEADWRALDPGALTLLDVDTAADLDEIRRRLAH
jgi:molybdopterin-guanine dinucleotide biosynthesis protein A